MPDSKPDTSRPKPFHSKYGDLICIGGVLWELTYSEMGPPDSRQSTGALCPTCCHDKAEKFNVQR